MHINKYIKLFVCAIIVSLIAFVGMMAYKQWSFRASTRKVAESIEKKEFANNNDTDPVFRITVDTSKSLDTEEGRAQFKNNLKLLNSKVELMKQTNKTYENL